MDSGDVDAALDCIDALEKLIAGEEDEDMEDESLGEAGRRGLGAAFTEDEQVGELSIDEDYDMDTR